MGEKFSRSLDMLKRSAGILNQDRALLAFPLLSALAAMLVFASFVPLFMIDATSTTGSAEFTAANYGQFDVVAFLLLYLAEYFVMFFFNSALVGAALIRMDGGNPTVMDGLRIAVAKSGRILGYALIAATVGLFLRAAGERLGFIGRAMAGVFGVAWTVAAFLTVPVLVSRDIGPVDAVKESATLLKRTWGENVILNSGIGLVFMGLYVVTLLVSGVLIGAAASAGSGSLILGIIVVTVLWAIMLSLLQAALQGIFSAVLYRFATDGEQTSGFSADELSGAFLPR